MNEFVTLQELGTFAVICGLTSGIVQFFKNKGGLKNFKTQYFAWIVAFILMTGYTVFTVGFQNPATYFMNAVNAFIIAGVTSNTANFVINYK